MPRWLVLKGLSDMDAMIIFNQIFSIFRVLHDHGFTLQRQLGGGGTASRSKRVKDRDTLGVWGCF